MRTHLRIACLIAIGLVASLVLAACSGSKTSGPKLRADLTYEEIAGALFDAGDLPPDLAHLQADPENPVSDTEESAIDGSFDIEEDRRDLETFGWEGEWYTQFSASPEANEIFFLVTTAALYETAEGAQGELEDQLVEAVDFAGRTNEDGTTFVGAQEFGVDGLGEEAIGLRYTFSTESESGEIEFYANLVAFRVDRLIGIVALGSLELKDMRPTGLRLAGLLAKKFNSLVEPV